MCTFAVGEELRLRASAKHDVVTCARSRVESGLEPEHGFSPVAPELV